MTGAILTNRSAKDRNSVDFYETPEQATVALADFLEANCGLTNAATIWEPACGKGKLANVFRARGGIALFAPI